MGLSRVPAHKLHSDRHHANSRLNTVRKVRWHATPIQSLRSNERMSPGEKGNEGIKGNAVDLRTAPDGFPFTRRR